MVVVAMLFNEAQCTPILCLQDNVVICKLQHCSALQTDAYRI